MMFKTRPGRLQPRLIFSILVLAAALSAILFLFLASPATSQGPVGTDPHIPPFATIDPGLYLQLRDEHLALLRGIPSAQSDSRLRAVEQMQRQIEQRPRRAPGAVAAQIFAFIGPAPIPNGQVTGGGTVPVSGRVTAIDVDPANSNIAYVGTAQGGLYRTLNGGATWTALMDAAQSLAIGAVTIDPLDSTKVFVGTGEGNGSGDSFFGVGLYRIDSAKTTPILNGPYATRVAGTGTSASNGLAFTGTAITRIAVDPANDNRIFVGNKRAKAGKNGDSGICCGGTTPPSAFVGLYFSSGALGTPTFSRVNLLPGSGQGDVTDIVFEPASSDNMLVGVVDTGGFGASGIYRTTDATSAPASSPSFTQVLPMTTTFNSKLAINKVGGTVTALAATGVNTTGELFKSTDGGVTWPISITVLGASGTGFCDMQCFYDIAVEINPSNANIIYLGGASNSGTTSNVLVKSTDGSTFTRTDTNLHADTHALRIAPSLTTTVYEGNDGGIWKSVDSGASWTSLNNTTFSATQFESLALHPTNANFSIGGTQDNGTNFRKADGTWTRADFGDGGFAAIDQNAADTTNVTMYHTYFNQTGGLIGLTRVTSTACATDNGTVSEWVFRGYGYVNASTGCEGVARGASNGINSTDAVLFYAPIALGPGNPNTVYFGTDSLYRSANKGDTITLVSQAPFSPTVRVSAIGISPQNDSVRIVGLTSGKVYRTSTGANPLDDVTSGSMPVRYVARAVIDPNNQNTAYVAFSGYGVAADQHVWKTTNLNAGTPTWAAAGSGIPDVPVDAFVVDPSNSSNLYAGTDIGVYASTNGGTSWSPFATGLPVVAVFDMAIHNLSRMLHIATHGRGMWQVSLFNYTNSIYLPLVIK